MSSKVCMTIPRSSTVTTLCREVAARRGGATGAQVSTQGERLTPKTMALVAPTSPHAHPFTCQ